MFDLEFTATSQRFLSKIPQRDAEIILDKLYSIRDNPYRFLKKLSGNKLWRLRIMDYRAIVDVVMSMNKIIVVRIGKRENIYN